MSILASAQLNFRIFSYSFNLKPQHLDSKSRAKSQLFCSIAIKPSWKMFYVDINLQTHSQSTFVAVLVLIPAPNQTTCVWHVEWINNKNLLDGSADKEPACNAGDSSDTGLIPGSGRTPGGGNGNPLQYSCLENPMNRGVWQVTVQRVAKSCIRLSKSAHGIA